MNRRAFLYAPPAAMLAGNGLSQLFAQSQILAGQAEPPADVIDFWINAMGVPHSMIAGASSARGRSASQGPQIGDYGREPLLLHYDENEKTLVASTDIPKDKLNPSGDANVEFQLLRMRLNPGDHQQFEKYTSGGLYLDVQQHPASRSGGANYLDLASSLFSAIFLTRAHPRARNRDSKANAASSRHKRRRPPARAEAARAQVPHQHRVHSPQAQ